MENSKMENVDSQNKENMINQGFPQIKKYTMKTLELRVQKFVKILELDLDRLFKHTDNISRLINTEDWNSLHKEQVNASRTIEQIKTNIFELEKARDQLKDDDLYRFDIKTQAVKCKTLLAMDKFMAFFGNDSYSNFHTNQSNSEFCEENRGQDNVISVEKISNQHFYNRMNSQRSNPQNPAKDTSQTIYGNLPATLAPLSNRLLCYVPQNSQASASLEMLQESIAELNDVVHNFAKEEEKQDKVNNNNEDSNMTFQENIKHEAQPDKPANYKTALLPVVGAIVGGVVAGPIGLVAGLKVGGLVGAVGGAVGFASGKLVKAHQVKLSETEMKKMSDKRSVSLSDVPEIRRPSCKRMSSSPENISQQSVSNEQNNQKEEEQDVFSAATASFKKFFS